MSRSRTSTIGPYRLEDRLGAGGMGEVWRAWDERLDRSVAVKLIRPESAEDQTARERFRREARAAAALNHPAIVRIYDVVESGEGEAIVMELVEGEPLSRQIARGPLPVEEAVRLGRQIAEGLAAAHRRGILHRDLKAENVIVTPEGEAKILDFGLAKRLDGEAEASLTRSAAVVGTFCAMSPEQARGMALDHRSDLFSFGIVMYEMLTGISPFKAGSVPDTLIRICTFRQPPVRELRPEVPEELSSLIDHLLEKDPAFRPQGAGETASELERMQLLSSLPFPNDQATTRIEPIVPALLARSHPARPASRRWILAVLLAVPALALAVWFMGWYRGAPLHVAVLRPEIVRGTGDGAGLLALGLRDALFRGLLDFQNLYLLSPEQVDPISGPPVKVARAVAVDELITSQLECDATICQISLARVRGSDGRLLWTQTFSAPIDRPYLLAEVVQGYLRDGYPDRRHHLGRGLEVRPQDYTEYLRLNRSFETREQEEISVESLLARLQEVRRTSPHFLEAYLFESEVLASRFRSRRDPADLEKAFALLGQARDFAPSDPRLFFSLFEVSMLAVQLDRAEEALRELERLQPGDPGVEIRRARLLERQGRGQEALALLEPALRRQPSWKYLFWAAQVENRQGKTAAARRHLEELLKRNPGHYTGLSTLAQIELLAGSPRRAAEIYTELVRRSPQFEEISQLGLALFLLRRYPESEQRYRQALDLEPNNPFAVLNLADVVLLRGDGPQAARLYERVLHLIEQDPAAASSWQHFTVGAQAQAHLGRPREAVDAVQHALRLAPDNPQAALEVALVQTLIGDRASALFNAERALDQGVEPVWFQLPWFDPLRESAEFRDRLERQKNAAGDAPH